MMRLMAVPLVAGRVDTGLLRDFGTWMTSEQRRVNALCRRMLQDPDEADSATQDISLDGPEQIHDVIRRVPGTYAALASGVRRLRELNPDSRIAGRCTVQRSNCESLLMT